MNHNNNSSPHRLIRAFLREPVDMTPVWLMRQAGRYLPEYRETRKKAGNFLTLCKTPELACEVTLQPLQRFALDGAIIFSDILTIPDAMGLGLHFVENEGPQFSQPLKTAHDIQALKIPDPETELRYVMDAIRVTKKELHDRVPLIGFAGSPWTLATYMIEGGSSKNFSKAKKMLYESPTLMKQLLDTLAKSITLYLKAQIAAGADAVMIFDTWGGTLSTEAYLEFSLSYMQQIVSELDKPSIIFTKNGGQWLEAMADSGANVIGLDWTTNIGTARKRIGNKVALQGNLDPSILYASPECIREECKKILTSYGNHPGHIFNLGHGILPDVPFEHVSVLVDTVHELSKTRTHA